MLHACWLGALKISASICLIGLIDFHSGLLSKGPADRADGDRDHHLSERDGGGGGIHTTGREPNNGGRGGPGSAAAFMHLYILACPYKDVLLSGDVCLYA